MSLSPEVRQLTQEARARARDRLDELEHHRAWLTDMLAATNRELAELRGLIDAYTKALDADAEEGR